MKKLFMAFMCLCAISTKALAIEVGDAVIVVRNTEAQDLPLYRSGLAGVVIKEGGRHRRT